MKTKLMIIFCAVSTLTGLFLSLFNKNLSAEISLLIITIVVIASAFIIRKIFAKELKNDEMQKKIGIMSDAVAGRTAVFSLCAYWLADMTGLVKNIPSLSTVLRIEILFFIIVISASIAAVYYSKNPHKLP